MLIIRVRGREDVKRKKKIVEEEMSGCSLEKRKLSVRAGKKREAHSELLLFFFWLIDDDGCWLFQFCLSFFRLWFRGASQGTRLFRSTTLRSDKESPKNSKRGRRTTASWR